MKHLFNPGLRSISLFFILNGILVLKVSSQENYLPVDSIPQESREQYIQFRESLENYIYILDNGSQDLRIEEVSSPELSSLFVPYSTFTDFKEKHVYWAKLNLRLNRADSVLFVIEPYYSDYFEVYVPSENGYDVFETGRLLASSKNDELYSNSNEILVTLKSDLNQSPTLTSIYIRFHDFYHTKPYLGIHVVDMKTEVYRLSELLDWRRKYNFANGLIYGVLWLILSISLILFMFQKRREFLFYSMYILFMSLVLIIAGGILLKNLREYDFIMQQISAYTALYFYFRFFIKVAEFKNVVKWPIQFIKTFRIIYPVILGIVILFLQILKRPGQLYNLIVVSIVAVYVIHILYLVLVLSRSKIIQNKLLSIGSLFLFISALYAIGGIIFDLPLWYLVLRMGVVAQVITFAYILIYRLMLSERLKRESDEKLIAQLDENAKLQVKVNLELEQKVAERTEEILQQKEEIEAQRDEIEVQRDQLEIQRDTVVRHKNDILDSITYAKKIQTALMPPEHYFHEILNDGFILFKPRDIVSGDFYWIKQVNQYVILAAADCTGHGVPGAFMSMLGMSYLNEIVHRREITQANQILNELRRQIRNSLRQHGQPEESKDGIDMALCVIDEKNRVLQYSGANNPLYLIRDKNGTPELTEFKADRMPLGFYPGKFKTFMNSEIHIEFGDVLYLFSDGFIDQKGGAEGKKFLSKNFKKLLLEIHEEPMQDQKQILDKTITDWMGEHPQIDDMLVIGIRV